MAGIDMQLENADTFGHTRRTTREDDDAQSPQRLNGGHQPIAPIITMVAGKEDSSTEQQSYHTNIRRRIKSSANALVPTRQIGISAKKTENYTCRCKQSTKQSQHASLEQHSFRFYSHYITYLVVFYRKFKQTVRQNNKTESRQPRKK
jgi:intergrase/recombinase